MATDLSSSPGHKGLYLRRLSCPSCGAPLASEGDDILFFCTACYSGFYLGTGATAGELVPVEVSFLALPGAEVARHLPFWSLPTRAEILDRRSSGGSSSGLLKLFELFGGGEEQTPGSREVSFLIPAFAAPLETITSLALRYTEAPPRTGELLAEKLTGGRLRPEDAQKLAHFTLIASEAEKPDTLQHLSYRLDFGVPKLIGVPFVDRGGRLADGFFGSVI